MNNAVAARPRRVASNWSRGRGFGVINRGHERGVQCAASACSVRSSGSGSGRRGAVLASASAAGVFASATRMDVVVTRRRTNKIGTSSEKPVGRSALTVEANAGKTRKAAAKRFRMTGGGKIVFLKSTKGAPAAHTALLTETKINIWCNLP